MIDRTRKDSRQYDADPVTTDLLREAYRAPQDEAYWVGLEQRVMRGLVQSVTNGVRELKPAWWSGFSEFRASELRAAGLVAATIAFLVAGGAMVQEQKHIAEARERAAREALESTLPLKMDDATLTRGKIRLAPDAPERYLNPLDY